MRLLPFIILHMHAYFIVHYGFYITYGGAQQLVDPQVWIWGLGLWSFARALHTNSKPYGERIAVQERPQGFFQ